VAALLVVLLVLLAAPAGAAADPRARAAAATCPGADVAPTGHNASLVDAATLCLMNQLRRARGMHPLHANRVLASIASGQARDMVRGHYFADQSFSG
jgi:uncharacterized protein YkwD